MGVFLTIGSGLLALFGFDPPDLCCRRTKGFVKTYPLATNYSRYKKIKSNKKQNGLGTRPCQQQTNTFRSENNKLYRAKRAELFRVSDPLLNLGSLRALTPWLRGRLIPRGSFGLLSFWRRERRRRMASRSLPRVNRTRRQGSLEDGLKRNGNSWSTILTTNLREGTP